MISIKEALQIIGENIPENTVAEHPIENCLDKVLAEDIISPEPLPRYTNSAMDGFAVKWDDIKSVTDDNNLKLKIVGESRAGIPYNEIIQSGEAISISTGGMLPEGADTIVPVEEADVEDLTVKIKAVRSKGVHVRYCGEEIQPGEVLLKAGKVLNPACIGLLASIGIEKVKIYKSPEISLITTGTELMPIGSDLKPWQIRDSNSIMLKSAIENSGGTVKSISNARDDINVLKKVISNAEEKSDMVIISGGVSVGPHDLVKKAAIEKGFEQLFWRVKQKPGKPLFVAKKDNKMLFGLPGNPVSALNCFAYYVYPVIRNLLGLKFSWKIVEAHLTEGIVNNGKRPNFQRVKLDRNEESRIKAIPIEKLGSHMLTSIAYANGFFVTKPGESFNPNDKVEVYLYPWEKY